MLDITERRRAQSALQDAQVEIARVARVSRMGAMTASIAHEIAQPLGAMVSNANAGLRWLTQPTPVFGEVRALLENIVRADHRASEIIQGIRALFKESPPTRTALDLNRLIGEVVSLAQREIEKHAVTVDIHLDEALPLVAADKVRMQQVIFNLVTNALDTMAPIKDRSRILRIKSAVDGSGDVQIAIEDTGTGVRMEDTDRIFSTFFTTKAHGMGMGLAICRSIIETHDGRPGLHPACRMGQSFKSRYRLAYYDDLRSASLNVDTLRREPRQHRRVFALPPEFSGRDIQKPSVK
jgi:C4-dicarboxylate-specific signal transduction histidine kinase